MEGKRTLLTPAPEGLFENISELVRNKHDAFLQQGNDEIEDQMRDSVDGLIGNEDPAKGVVFLGGAYHTQNTHPILTPDDELNSKIGSLNEMQKAIFDLVHD